ncbi:sodium/potassium/calcium exchanger 1-like isoform X2 [Narcine bancroftii]|uniref:sodium/potassium/calcium exchanger 1-like isoform X2 n=1 Tax=Narcine bancroftii TaxID=1343680 RepID=UPI0038312FDA
MGTSANPRKRILSREMSEDENMMIMIKEEDFKEKYMDAVESIGHLETEKVLLMYEVEQLRDVLEGTEEELAELHWRHAQVAKELESEKVAKYLLLQKVNYMKEQLEERKMSEVIEIAAAEDTDRDIQSHLEDEEYSGAKRMELKSDDCGKCSVQTLLSTAADLAEMEQKQSMDSSYETKHIMQHETNVPEEITNRKSIERSVSTFTQGADAIHREESTRLIEAGENASAPENVTHVPQCETEMSKSDRVIEGRGSQTFEPVKLVSEERESEYKGREAEEASQVAFVENSHNERQNEDEIGAREQGACGDLDAQGHKIVMGGSVQAEGNQSHTDSSTKANNGGKEKGPFDVFVQMLTTVIAQQKNLTRSEGRRSRKSDADSVRSEMHGEREGKVKEQNEEHSRANANHEQCGGKEQRKLESFGDGYEEKDFTEKELFQRIHEPTQPEGDKAPREFPEEAEGSVDDPSDEEMHDAAENMVPELNTTMCTEERQPDTKDDPESTPNNLDMGLGKSLNVSESTREHLKNKDACHIS